ncbi:MAG: GNAT family N-acetyltransferase, partial [Anaerovorax sp.]
RKDFLKSKSQGFQIFLIEDSPGEFAGFCDYKPGAETYLSILLIDGKRKGVGIGKKVYTQLENTLRTEGACAVRIDVLYEYAENALGFWEKQGFVATEKIAMDWEGHKSTAIKMIKIL